MIVAPRFSSVPFRVLCQRVSLAAVGALGLGLLFGTARAVEPGLRVESFRVVSADAASARLEIVAIRGDEHAQMLLGIVAKSRDGTRYSTSFRPVLVPEGKKVQFTAEVTRPDETGAQQTDYLWVSAYRDGEAPFMRTRLEWPHAWPANGGDGAGVSAQDLQAMQAPSAIFDANLTDEDFGALDVLLKKWNTPQARDANGDWKLDGFRRALSNIPGASGWDEHLARILRWTQFNPRSPGAAIAEARHWADYAWHIRGCSCGCGCREARATDPVAMRVFRQRVSRAERVLLSSKAYAGGNPLWYETYLEIAIDSGRSDRFIRGLFEKAIARFPLYQPLYAGMAMYWVPPDGRRPNWNMVELVADTAVNLTRATDGEDNYAWLYVQIAARHRYDQDVMGNSDLSWPRMSASFKELVERYPSPENMNTFAAFACRAHDKINYLNLRAKIRGHIVPGAWQNGYSVDTCDHMFTRQI
jgi:hypothetical protein